jgi:hypothetical protein
MIVQRCNVSAVRVKLLASCRGSTACGCPQ